METRLVLLLNKMMRYVGFCLMVIALCGCTTYSSPSRDTWPSYLRGASFTDMTDTARMAKKPVYIGAGGTLITDENAPVKLEYGDKGVSDNIIATNYMSKLEYELYDSLLKPGISVQRAGTEVVIILVRDAIMDMNAPNISATGADTLGIISRILKKYNSTFIEIAGYTDAMRDTNAAYSLSMDMASRVGVFMSQHRIDTTRMFIVGRGAARPIADQGNIGRLTNRRVEIRIVPVR